MIEIYAYILGFVIVGILAFQYLEGKWPFKPTRSGF